MKSGDNPFGWLTTVITCKRWGNPSEALLIFFYTVNEIERLEQNYIPENNTLEIVRGATGNY